MACAWIGVGGSPESVVRAARYGIPMMLAIIGVLTFFSFRLSSYWVFYETDVK